MERLFTATKEPYKTCLSCVIGIVGKHRVYPTTSHNAICRTHRKICDTRVDRYTGTIQRPPTGLKTSRFLTTTTFSICFPVVVGKREVEISTTQWPKHVYTCDQSSRKYGGGGFLPRWRAIYKLCSKTTKTWDRVSQI